MAVLALVLLAVWLLLVVSLPTLVRLRRTGTASVPRFRDRPGSPQWWARLVSALGFACAVAAPLAELAGLQPIPILDRTPVRAAGVVLVAVGIAATLAAQLAMGASWRPDVDPAARTALVTSGPFRLVRNPIFTATAATAAGRRDRHGAVARHDHGAVPPSLDGARNDRPRRDCARRRIRELPAGGR
jgi:protein-S-isoprenylcysteine O-methyltransferase Ste14